MRFVLVAGTTRTARIDGISAAGATPTLARHTPSADAEILVFGRPVHSPVVPVSPEGCPTPAAMTRAVREAVGFPVTVVDGGLAEPAAVRTVPVDASPGGDVRAPEPVPAATAIFERAREVGRSLAAEHLVLAETVPGGTTTALGVLRALGERPAVSSSKSRNPLERKRSIVEAGLEASGLAPGGAAGEPVRAIRLMGDPVLAAVAGLARGAMATDGRVTLAGGTQLLAASALLRHDGVSEPLAVATTSFVLEDPSAEVGALAESLDVEVRATDPGFEGVDHPAAAAFRRGEAKEGVGMGGALDVARRSDTSMAAVRERFLRLVDELGDGGSLARQTPEGP